MFIGPASSNTIRNFSASCTAGRDTSLMLPDKISRFGTTEIEKQLTPFVGSNLSGAENNAVGQFLASFKSRANAAHQYCHASLLE